MFISALLTSVYQRVNEKMVSICFFIQYHLVHFCNQLLKYTETLCSSNSLSNWTLNEIS